MINKSQNYFAWNSMSLLITSTQCQDNIIILGREFGEPAS